MFVEEGFVFGVTNCCSVVVVLLIVDAVVVNVVDVYLLGSLKLEVLAKLGFSIAILLMFLLDVLV